MTKPGGPDLAPGLYEALVTKALARKLGRLDTNQFQSAVKALDGEDARDLLVNHVGEVLSRALRILPKDADGLALQLGLCNAVVGLLQQEVPLTFDGADEQIEVRGQILEAVLETAAAALGSVEVPRPKIPLSTSALLVNDRREPSLASELATEITSADSIDLLCAFIRWNGLRVLLDPLKALLEKGRTLRVITTTYMGATERRAIDALAGMGAQVKVSYEARNTRLHAKAWSFHRNSGYSTAYVGSSNLSHSALHEGLEWNVRLSRIDATSLLDKFKATFETYWADPHFELYDPAKDARRFDQAVAADTRGDDVDFSFLDIHPFGYQQEILYQLDVERERHARWANLVVAATGTGKTVIAALDYRRIAEQWRGATLLFVAHRKEILRQSLGMFRTVMKEGSFGELLVEGARPTEGKHVFASIQSFSQLDLSLLDPKAYDMVIVDEFHHTAAQTYQRLLNHLKPRLLLGLTATPERADGTNVADWFGGHIAAELRLWEALEQGLLTPFQYFGIHDDVDLSQIRWQRGGYQIADLENVYTGNDARVSKILASIMEIVADPRAMRALGFCVSIRHAEYMARKFSQAGIPAAAISATSPRQERDSILRRLKNREVNVVFAVDLFNEGIDVPEIDTVLFLRPTESATVFLQQLGRGLRLSNDKSCLTALDFVGHQSKHFRFDQRFKALLGMSRGELRRSVEEGFPFLPAGCHIELDRVSQDVVLENLAEAIGSNWRSLVGELRQMGDVSLKQFLSETQLELADVYRNRRTWTALRRDAGFPAPAEGPDERQLRTGIGRLLHIDDPQRLNLYRGALASNPPAIGNLGKLDERLMLMLHFGLWGTSRPFENLRAGYEQLAANPAVIQELLEVFELLDETSAHIAPPFSLPLDVPLSLHARYTASEALAALGELAADRPRQHREGVFYSRQNNTDLFFVTLQKSEKEYSPTTMYRDYAISPDLFHWESQSTTSQASPTGQRYINGGGQVLLFVRERKETAGKPLPCWFIGPARYVTHEGERPMAITWKLDLPMPPDLFASLKVAAA